MKKFSVFSDFWDRDWNCNSKRKSLKKAASGLDFVYGKTVILFGIRLQNVNYVFGRRGRIE